MCAGVMWDLLPIERSENRITDAYRLFSLDGCLGEMPLEAIPIAVVDAN
jgi:hypothetical protein